MNCPKCGTTCTIITYPVYTDSSMIERQRKCVACDYEFVSVELPKEDYDRMKGRADNFQTMISDRARDKAKEMIERNGGLG